MRGSGSVKAPFDNVQPRVSPVCQMRRASEQLLQILFFLVMNASCLWMKLDQETTAANVPGLFLFRKASSTAGSFLCRGDY